MARYTQAYSSLSGRLNEVRTLCRLASQTEADDPIRRSGEINALMRGAVVLLSSHIEAFIKELGEVAISSLYAKSVPRDRLPSRFYYHISKGELTAIRSSREPDKVAEKVFEFLDSHHVAYWSRTGSFPRAISAEEFSRGFSNPKVRPICKYFGRFGYTEFRRDLGRTLGATYQITVNAIDHIVDTRNAIAHGERVSKTPIEVRELLGSARSFCRSTDGLFASWWRARYCAIR